VAVKNYYELLDLAPTASADEIKRAFRQQIARYHPDKVQHLGTEFQQMAADRAAELTEAYRILSDDGRRAEYDRNLGAGGEAPGAAPAPAGRSAAQPRPEPAVPSSAPPPPPSPSPTDSGWGAQFSQERATRDEFVRKATVGRMRQAFEAVGGYDETQVRGFDLAWLPKSKLFARGKGPRLLARFVSRVDGEAVSDAWTQAAKWAGNDDVCVLLIGPSLAPAGELAGAIADQRRKSRSTKVTLIPVDARNWDAHLPTDAPASAKTLLARLRSGA
jgi:curved DNA-binding protein CbpA